MYLIYFMGSDMADAPLLGWTILYQPKASQTFAEAIHEGSTFIT